MSLGLLLLLGHAASKLVVASLLRGIVIALLWLSAPPLLFVALSWLLLRDTDFSTLLARHIRGCDDSTLESYYFCGRVCWVTGATSAIGQELATRLARQGALLVLSGRNTEALTAISERCKRAYLVSQIRSRRRSDAEVHNIVEEVTNQCTTRVLAIPLDIADPGAVSQALKTALAWRGRIDALFNNAGLEGKPALVPESQQVSRQMMVSCMAPLTLARAAVAAALRAAPCDQLGATDNVLRFPELQRLSTRVIGTIGSTAEPLAPRYNRSNDSPVTRLVSFSSTLQQFSRRGAEFSWAVLTRNRVYRLARQVVLGTDNEPPARTFHLVNTMSLVSRLGFPGHGASGASKAALDAFCRTLQKEVAAFATCFRQHNTDVIVTSCFLHGIQNGEGPVASDPSVGHLPSGSSGIGVGAFDRNIAPERCAELIIRGAAYGLHECWIARHPYLLYAYIAYYMPWVWRYLSFRFLDRSNFLAVWSQLQADQPLHKPTSEAVAHKTSRSGSTASNISGNASIESTCETFPDPTHSESAVTAASESLPM